MILFSCDKKTKSEKQNEIISSEDIPEINAYVKNPGKKKIIEI